SVGHEPALAVLGGFEPAEHSVERICKPADFVAPWPDGGQAAPEVARLPHPRGDGPHRLQRPQRSTGGEPRPAHPRPHGHADGAATPASMVTKAVKSM